MEGLPLFIVIRKKISPPYLLLRVTIKQSPAGLFFLR